MTSFIFRREHLSEEDLQKNKALMENLTKGNLVENCEVCKVKSILLNVNAIMAGYITYLV